MLASLVLMAAMTVDNVLPAGNIVYERTEGDTVYVHQELRDTEGDWFYWAMRYRAADNTPWGTDWNTDRNYAKGMSCIRWAMGNLPSVRICRTYEVPFANANGAVVTGETCRELGRDTAKVVRAFLTSEPCAGTSEK